MDKTIQGRPLSPRERVRVRASKELLVRAKAMRHESSNAERALWRQLRGRRLAGYKFRRQVVIAPFIVDFVCFEAKLIVEADGGQHADRGGYDARRSTLLEQKGYRVIRFWNNEILSNLEGVLARIVSALSERPHPGPLPGGEGDQRG